MPSVTQMAAAKHCAWATAATEHSPEEALLQSTEMFANVVFINIDWKASRMFNTLEKNMKLLAETIANVVQNMSPAMICMCEVGEAEYSLTLEQMQQVSHESMRAWKEAATEHLELKSMFEVGAPYMTIYKDSEFQCTRHHILKDLYNAGSRSPNSTVLVPRTAQTFLCRGPGDVTVDVINVHAPSSSKRKLTDRQRMALLTSLLQSNSNSMPGRAIGYARFLIGGDANTSPLLLSLLLQGCRQNGSLHTPTHIHEPLFGEHGDICVRGAFPGTIWSARTLTTTAQNHDRRHKPYGICWLVAEESASQERAASSSGYATEQPLQAYPAQSVLAPTLAPALAPAAPAKLYPESPLSSDRALQEAWALSGGPSAEVPKLTTHLMIDRRHVEERNAPVPHPAPEPAMPARFEFEIRVSTAQQPELTESDMEDVQRTGDVVELENSQRTPDEETAVVPPAAATEHRPDPSTPQLASQEPPADRGMIYAIVNEFLGKVTFKSQEAEELLLALLKDESCLPLSMELSLQEVFWPIFFNYPHGLKDRSVWQERDTSKYIREWYKLAAMRPQVTTDATATEHGKQLSKDGVTQIFKRYMQHMKTEPRPGQTKINTSCAEFKMRREAGSTFVANAIWMMGLPRLPPFATARQDEQLSAQDLKAVPAAIRSVLNWLYRIASSLQQHHTTPEYQDAVRKSGVAHGHSGLTATEHEKRTAKNKAKSDIRKARELDAEWRAGRLTCKNWYRWQENLLRALWDGSLQRHLESQGSADVMCRTPLHTL